MGAQQPDGYLNTYFTVVAPDKRWSNLRDLHELYCMGHLMEAAAAHHQATGSAAFLDVMLRCAVSWTGPSAGAWARCGATPAMRRSSWP